MAVETGVVIWLGGGLALFMLLTAMTEGRGSWRLHGWVQATWLVLSVVLFGLVALGY